MNPHGFFLVKHTAGCSGLKCPGCLVLDEQLPGLQGSQLQQMLEEMGAGMPVIFLTAYASVDLTIGAFRRGACDFLTKPVDPAQLSQALEKAAAAEERRRLVRMKESPEGRYALLTEREKELAPLVAQALTSAAIGERLSRSPRTIERHRAEIFKKLGLRTPAELKSFLARLADERERAARHL